MKESLQLHLSLHPWTAFLQLVGLMCLSRFLSIFRPVAGNRKSDAGLCFFFAW
jgi:hypothetical protein